MDGDGPGAPYQDELNEIVARSFHERVERLRDASLEVGTRALSAGLCGAPCALAVTPPPTSGIITVDVVIACLRNPHPIGEYHESQYNGTPVYWINPWPGEAT